MKISDFDYALPAENIARHPAKQRDHSRLMVLDRVRGSIEHKKFYEILDYLNAGDALVVNNSKVLPARLFGHKTSGGALIEFLLIEQLNDSDWKALIRPARRLREGDKVEISAGFSAVAGKEVGAGERVVSFRFEKDFRTQLEEFGHMPLPPYIVKARRDFENIASREAVDLPEDHVRYQTVYAKEDGSVAAPTAGLHFTKELLQAARDKGIDVVDCTLHVGPGTFKPVTAERIEDHDMHSEKISIGADAIEKIISCRERKGRVVCVGTTSVRVLETVGLQDELQPIEKGSTDLLLVPGSEFRLTDVMLTNFHLPRSTLLMLVSAFAGQDFILRAYEEAVKNDYRFYSYGDAMLIL